MFRRVEPVGGSCRARLARFRHDALPTLAGRRDVSWVDDENPAGPRPLLGKASVS